MAATGINGGHFDVASSPFMWSGGALMWQRGITKKSKWKELINRPW